MHDPLLHKKAMDGHPLTEEELMRYVRNEIERQTREKVNPENAQGEKVYTLLWCHRNNNRGNCKKITAKNSQAALAKFDKSGLINVMAFPVILPDALTWRESECEH